MHASPEGLRHDVTLHAQVLFYDWEKLIAPGFLVLLHWPSPAIFIVDLTFSSFLCHFSALLCDHPVVICASFSQDTQDAFSAQGCRRCHGAQIQCVRLPQPCIVRELQQHHHRPVRRAPWQGD